MKSLFATRKAVLLAALFSGVLAADRAHAATLVSPSLIASTASGEFVACIIVNVSSKDITANVELMSFQGTVLKQETVNVPPGVVDDVSLGGIPGGYCRFSGKFTSKKVRTSINVVGPALQTRAVAPAQ